MVTGVLRAEGATVAPGRRSWRRAASRACAAGAAGAVMMLAAAACGGPRAATWRASVQSNFQPATSGQGVHVVVDAVLTPSAAIPDERAVLYGPPGLAQAGIGAPPGAATLLPGPSAQPPTGWVVLAQGGAGGRTDPGHPLKLHNEFDISGQAGKDPAALRGMLSQSRLVLVWGDKAVGTEMMQWFYNAGKSPQPAVKGSFTS
jgi:hypothetical protein